MNYCGECGSKLKKGNKHCTQCGAPMVEEKVKKPAPVEIKNNVETPEEKIQGNKYAYISLGLTFGVPFIVGAILYMYESYTYVSSINVLFNSVAMLSEMSPLAGLVVLIIGRSKYPKNLLLKIIMWIYLVLIFLIIAVFVLVIASCFAAASSGCPG